MRYKKQIPSDCGNYVKEDGLSETQIAILIMGALTIICILLSCSSKHIQKSTVIKDSTSVQVHKEIDNTNYDSIFKAIDREAWERETVIEIPLDTAHSISELLPFLRNDTGTRLVRTKNVHRITIRERGIKSHEESGAVNKTETRAKADSSAVKTHSKEVVKDRKVTRFNWLWLLLLLLVPLLFKKVRAYLLSFIWKI